MIAQKIQKELLKRGATDVVITTSKDKNQQIKFSNNLISTTETWHAASMDIFIAIKNRVAITSIKEFDKKTINTTINELIKLAKLSEPNKDYSMIAKGPFKYKKIPETYDKRILKVNPISIVEDSISIASSEGAKRTSGVLETSESETQLISSYNIKAQTKGTSIHLSLRALAEKDASGHLTCTSRVLNKFKYREIAKQAGVIASQSKNPKPGNSGKYDVLFAPLAFANLLALTGDATSIFSVESGFSFLKNKLNKKIASNKINFFDSPLEPDGIGSSPFDAEGHPTINKALIQDGTLKTYLHNSSSAKRYKTKTTGNAGIISPHPFNLILKKSDWSLDEMIKETKKGLLITNLWYTRFKNYSTGEFSTIPRDGIFLIQNGKIKYPIKGIRISESLPNILNNVEAIGNNPTQIVSWETETPTTTPHVLVKNVNITKPKE